MEKWLLSVAGVALTFGMFIPYIRSILRGRTRPHVFSWVVWGLGTLIVFFAQLAGHAGAGAWPIGISGLITSYIAVLAFLKRADTGITRADWAFFLTAIAALPLWFVTADPLWAVVTLTIADVVGFGPTLRRAYHAPHEEHATFFALSAVRNLLVVLALEHYSLTTVLFPAAVGLACFLLVLLLLYRRRSLTAAAKQTAATQPE